MIYKDCLVCLFLKQKHYPETLHLGNWKVCQPCVINYQDISTTFYWKSVSITTKQCKTSWHWYVHVAIHWWDLISSRCHVQAMLIDWLIFSLQFCSWNIFPNNQINQSIITDVHVTAPKFEQTYHCTSYISLFTIMRKAANSIPSQGFESISMLTRHRFSISQK